MRCQLLHSLLLVVIGCCVGRPGMAQRAVVAPIAPIAPISSAIKPAGQQPALGMPVHTGAPVQRPVAPARPPLAGPGPLFILNSSVIIDLGNSSVNPNDIDKLTVYKGTDAPRQWQTLVNYGIIAITLKKGVGVAMKSRTLAAIGRELKLLGPVSYAVNGMPVAEAKLRIATDAIGKIDVTPATALQPTTLVDIRIINRIHTPSSHPPGTILIRGTASL